MAREVSDSEERIIDYIPHTKAHKKANSYYRNEGTVASAAKCRHTIHHQLDSNGDLSPHNVSFYNTITEADALGPIIKDHLPTTTPSFTDQGYPWLQTRCVESDFYSGTANGAYAD